MAMGSYRIDWRLYSLGCSSPYVALDFWCCGDSVDNPCFSPFVARKRGLTDCCKCNRYTFDLAKPMALSFLPVNKTSACTVNGRGHSTYRGSRVSQDKQSKYSRSSESKSRCYSG